MSRVEIPLESLRVASPCRADWDAMQGDDQVRFCASCAKNVYNLSSLNRSQAEALIAEKEGKLCVRFYQRTDGTVLTQDCPVGLSRVRHAAIQPFKWLAVATACLIASGIWVFSKAAASASTTSQPAKPPNPLSLSDIQPLKAVMDWASPPPLQGDVSAPSPTPTPTAPPIMGAPLAPPRTAPAPHTAK